MYLVGDIKTDGHEHIFIPAEPDTTFDHTSSSLTLDGRLHCHMVQVRDKRPIIFASASNQDGTLHTHIRIKKIG